MSEERTTPAHAAVLVTFVDCEATSFNGYCTEIGIAQVWKGRPDLGPDVEVNPVPDHPGMYIAHDSRLVLVDAWMDDYLKWDPAAERITGISRNLLKEQGRPAVEVAAWLNDRLAGLTTYSDARHFDRRWIDQVFKAGKTKRRFEVFQMEQLIERWDVDTEAFFVNSRKEHDTLHGIDKPHRAAADAINWAMIFLDSWREENATRFNWRKIFTFWWLY